MGSALMMNDQGLPSAPAAPVPAEELQKRKRLAQLAGRAARSGRESFFQGAPPAPSPGSGVGTGLLRAKSTTPAAGLLKQKIGE